MRKDLWLAPMSHCVVGRAVGGESCCDKERTVNRGVSSTSGEQLDRLSRIQQDDVIQSVPFRSPFE